MKNHSSKNSYSTSKGIRLTRAAIERKIIVAKRRKIEAQLFEDCYNYCEKCGKNANAGEPLDVSHTVSVKECLETGRADQAWAGSNLRILCRTCHAEYDKNNIQQTPDATI